VPGLPVVWVQQVRLGPRWVGADNCPDTRSPDGGHYWVIRGCGLPDRCKYCGFEGSPREWEQAHRRWYHGLAEYLLNLPIGLAMVALTPFAYVGSLIAIFVVQAVTGRGEDSSRELVERSRIWIICLGVGACFWIGLGLFLILA